MTAIGTKKLAASTRKWLAEWAVTNNAKFDVVEAYRTILTSEYVFVPHIPAIDLHILQYFGLSPTATYDLPTIYSSTPEELRLNHPEYYL